MSTSSTSSITRGETKRSFGGRISLQTARGHQSGRSLSPSGVGNPAPSKGLTALVAQSHLLVLFYVLLYCDFKLLFFIFIAVCSLSHFYSSLFSKSCFACEKWDKDIHINFKTSNYKNYIRDLYCSDWLFPKCTEAGKRNLGNYYCCCYCYCCCYSPPPPPLWQAQNSIHEDFYQAIYTLAFI